MTIRPGGTVLAVAVLIIVACGTGFGMMWLAASSTAPDRVIVPCSLWADDAKSTLPESAYTDRCATPDGTISNAD